MHAGGQYEFIFVVAWAAVRRYYYDCKREIVLRRYSPQSANAHVLRSTRR